MAKKCQGCKIKENYKYWTELPSDHYQFFTVMPHNFKQRLEIPNKFTECFREKLAPWCTLIGASQNRWRVSLSRSVIVNNNNEESSMAFSEGWRKYVADNGVEPSDSLVFRYVGKSSFKVIVFDKSGCEREGTHFASSSRNTGGCNSSLHELNNNVSDSDDSIQEIVPEEEEENDYDSGDSSEDDEDEDEEEEMRRGRKRSTTEGSSSNDHDNAEKKRQVQKFYVSKRRKLTREEQERASRMANGFMSQLNPNVPMFKIVMRPTNVYRGFFLTIPKKWAMKHMLNETHEVELRVPKHREGRSWFVGCSWTLTASRQCQLRSKWPMFVLDNNLEEHDCCVFELIKQDFRRNKTPIFDVHIFRAVDRIVPLSVSKRLV